MLFLVFFITQVALVIRTSALRMLAEEMQNPWIQSPEMNIGSLDKDNYNIQYLSHTDAGMPLAVLTGGKGHADSDQVKSGVDGVNTVLQHAPQGEKMGVIMDATDSTSSSANWDLIKTAIDWRKQNQNALDDKVAAGALVLPDTTLGSWKANIANMWLGIFGESDKYHVTHNMDDAKDWVTQKRGSK
eukprot:gnl/MRDRNA2_/MRDRNA2_70000_c0_seq1.p1 gnl/MRDRNA2_/MRDRNA2_70000_c0~~gnl/MRDRNA2_/MRDRNA2_70000_c0_seq1.p1  ORF type:complete len:187 (-),score=37.81 gnl/MRDRNA2_/MRDRNA2_70000_c0_seq1:67-627(-)